MRIGIITLMKVIGLHGGALLGVAYRTSRRISPTTASAISTISTMPMSGFGASGPHSSFDDPFANKSSEAAPQNYQLYRCVFWSYIVLSSTTMLVASLFGIKLTYMGKACFLSAQVCPSYWRSP
jgi:hypothetical protein